MSRDRPNNVTRLRPVPRDPAAPLPKAPAEVKKFPPRGRRGSLRINHENGRLVVRIEAAWIDGGSVEAVLSVEAARTVADLLPGLIAAAERQGGGR